MGKGIEPYYEDREAGIVIYCGDCRDILPLIPDKSIDLVLTDPPYLLTRGIGSTDKQYEGPFHMSENEYDIFCHTWFGLARTKTERIIFTPGTRSVWRYPPAKWMLCWHKPGAVNYNAFGGFNIWEPILVYGNLGPGRHFTEDFICSTPKNFLRGVERNHPCPKSMDVWGWLVQNGSAADETILDPFLGSGTTAYCAKKLGRKCIGIEIEEKYCEIAVKRLRQSVMHLELTPEPLTQEALL